MFILNILFGVQTKILDIERKCFSFINNNYFILASHKQLAFKQEKPNINHKKWRTEAIRRLGVDIKAKKKASLENICNLITLFYKKKISI